ncbi:Glucan endo-1 [Forsythia ovata]|uniref:Glucan endo-1 n=1 Tax=Forsythia ovata TaxID=205694 RepID=A0ABD1XB40_9LAMI
MARQVFILALIFLVVAGLVAADSSPSPAPKASFPKSAPSPKKSKSSTATPKASPYWCQSSALKSSTPSASTPSDSSSPAEPPTDKPSSPPALSSEASSPTPTTSKSSPPDALGPAASDAPSADAPTSDNSGTAALKIAYAIVAYSRKHPPAAAQVAQFFKDKTTIDRIKIFDVNPDILRTFVSTGIFVVVTVPNGEIPNLVNIKYARRWAGNNIKPFYPQTKINYILVGNEVLHWDLKI